MASSGRRAAVLGRPVAHSLSPVLHSAAYAALGLDWSYTAIECGAGELAEVVAARTDWAGFSCTRPLKHAALEVADETSALAQAVGAANTLVPLGAGAWRAENTDVDGIVQALRERAPAVAAVSSVTVLGAGGTAQATIAALAELGVTACVVLVRNPARAAPLAATAERIGMQLDLTSLRSDASELGADLVVSTLPPGAADPLASFQWRAGQVLLDVVYDPWPTALAAAAERAGVVTISGALMLLHQAAEQVRLMTGQPAPVAAMRTALQAAAPAAGL